MLYVGLHLKYKKKDWRKKKKKKYKEELSESKERQHDLIELQPECVKTVSRSGDLIYMNAMGLKYIEANSLEEVKGACVYDLITDEFREEFIQMNERVFSGETVRMEFEVEGFLGTRRWMETNARPIINSKGEVIEHFAITRDISERKDSEIKLKTTTRALKVLNDCNHYITHVTNEIKLAHHICEVIVNTGGYFFSWIGYAQNEAGKLVKPIANAGYEQGYLENKITWGDEPSGCGPSGTCIKNNEATIVHNIGNDDSFSLWRDSALEHGYLSVVALPLSIGNSTGEADAALVLYSSVAASFDCYEVDLLSTLANNLSYAIRSIRTKNEKQKAEIILAANEEQNRLLDEGSGAIVWECSFPEIEYSYVSNATETILGYQAEDWYQPGFWQSRIYPEDKERAIHQCASQASEGVDHTFEYRMLKSDGSIIWIQDVVHVVSDENNVPVRLRGLMIDITEKKQFEIALKESEERFSYAMLGASDGLWDWNMEAGQVYFSLRWKSMLGFEEEEIENSLNSFKKLLHTDDSERVFQHVEDYVSGKVDRYSIEFRLRHKKEYYLDIHSQGFGVRNNNNEIIRLVGTHTDITDRKLAEKALISSETRFRTLYDETPAVFFSVNQDGYIISINEFGASHLGYKTSEIIGQAIELIFHEEDTVKRMLECFNYPEGIQRWESSLLKKQSDSIRVRQSVRVVNGIDDELCLFIICEDITETHRLSEELKYQATHDSLTSLVNRREFEKRLDRVLNSQSILFPGHAVCYMDLDNFKVINDTCGHLAGDALLKQLTTLLSGSVRGRDTLARLGGDEFAILMENCSLKQAIAVAEKILAIVEKFNFVWGENKFKVGVSIGLVPINDAGISVVNILSAADSACYVAKESGRNRIHIFSHDDDELEKRKGEMQWVSRINQALEDNLFCLFYQEVVSGKSSKKADKRRFEILLRIKTYDGNYVLPGAFLPSAERYNLSTRIDEWVVAETLDWLTSDSSILDVVESCAINISGHSVCNEGFLEYCFNKIKTSGVSANKICFEITETAAIANLSSAKKFMSELGKEGCSFALDDFGSGLSSFGHLKSLPVDYIKIDGVFVRDIVTDPVDYEMVSAINRMGHVMNKKIIAEYVENDEISALLKKIGVDFIQGYGISKPQPIEAFLQV